MSNLHQRDLSIDILKTLVVIPMVIGHIIQLLFFQFGIINQTLVNITSYINLVSFGCFYFAFGYSVSIAYLPKTRQDLRPKLIKNFLRLLTGFYLSSICFVLCLYPHPTIKALIETLALRKIAGYSEFLLAFVFTIPIIYFFKNLISKAADWRFLSVCTLICFVGTFFPYSIVHENIIGIFIGTDQYPCFPIFQYFHCFLLGIFIQHNKDLVSKLRLRYMGGIYLCFVALFFFYITDFAQRFPPSFLWILCSSIPPVFYYVASKTWAQHTSKERCFIWIGKNVFSIVIISNIVLFIAYKMLRLLSF